MRYEMFSIKDCVAGTFGGITLFNNTAVAERWFDGICQKDSNIAKDLQLYKVGIFDLETGVVDIACTFVKSGVNTDEA